MKKIILSVIMVFAFANMAMYAQTPAKKTETKTEQSCDPCSGCNGGCSAQQKAQCHGTATKAEAKKSNSKKADAKKKDAKKECKSEKKATKSGCCSK